jgi:hypothetical protein
MTSIHWPGSPTCSPAYLITRRSASLERSHVGTADQDGAKRAAFADQRHGEDGTMSEPDRQFPPERRYRGGAKDRKDELFLHVFANRILTTGAAQPGGSIRAVRQSRAPEYGHVVRRA